MGVGQFAAAQVATRTDAGEGERLPEKPTMGAAVSRSIIWVAIACWVCTVGFQYTLVLYYKYIAMYAIV